MSAQRPFSSATGEEQLEETFDRLTLTENSSLMHLPTSPNMKRQISHGSFEIFPKTFPNSSKRQRSDLREISPLKIQSSDFNISFDFNNLIGNFPKEEDGSQSKKKEEKEQTQVPTKAKSNIRNFSEKSLILLGLAYGTLKLKGVDVDKNLMNFISKVDFEGLKKKLEGVGSLLTHYWKLFLEAAVPFVKSKASEIMPFLEKSLQFIEENEFATLIFIFLVLLLCVTVIKFFSRKIQQCFRRKKAALANSN